MRTIAIVNQKGGCGKTTTAINLAAFLAREARRTLVVDMDPQGHSTLGLIANFPQASSTLYEVFTHHVNGRDTTLADIIRPVHTNLDIAPSDIRLSAVPEALAGRPHRDVILAEILSDVRDRYDYVLVDCPPHVGMLTFNALRACSEAIVPIDPGFFALHGIGKLLETFEELRRRTGHRLSVRALVTLYGGRSQFARDVVDEIRRHLAGRHFNTVIRYSTKLAEAVSHGLPIDVYCRRCAGFEDYQALAAEVLEMESRSPQLAAPTITSEGVLFTFDAPRARRVQLVGDFNGWMLDRNEMTASGSVWTSLLTLGPGRYRYKYVVDGDWRSDPLNRESEPSPYGGNNSVIVIPETDHVETRDGV